MLRGSAMPQCSVGVGDGKDYQSAALLALDVIVSNIADYLADASLRLLYSANMARASASR